MKATNTFQIALALFLCASLFSCEKIKIDPTPEEGTAVETAEVTAGFDLSARSEWILRIGTLSGMQLGGHLYDYTVDGAKITATGPSSKPYQFEPGQTVVNGNLAITLAPRSYGVGTYNVGPIIPSLHNQSTLAKFTNCDALIGRYNGEVTPNLKNIQFEHLNALLIFSVTGLPENALVGIGQVYNQTIMPLQDSEDKTHYKAIVLPNNKLNNSLSLLVKIGDKLYVQTIPDMPAEPGYQPSAGEESIDGGTIVSFNAHINEEDRLIIEKLEKKPRAKNWPISQ